MGLRWRASLRNEFRTFLDDGKKRKMETLEGVRGREDVTRVRNGGKENEEVGEGQKGRNNQE